MTPPAPRLVAWEITRRCNLRCRHCRAAAERGPYAGELNLDEAKAVVDDLAAMGKPILILTGGEPLLCDFLFDLAAFAREKGLSCVLGSNATLIDSHTAQRLVDVGISRVSVSLDFPEAEAHDRFRGERGAFAKALAGMAALRAKGVGLQVNMTVTRLNRDKIADVHDLAVRLGAAAFHPFLLVPVGRGTGMTDAELSPDEYEETLRRICLLQWNSPLSVKPTDAPHYQRIVRQMGGCPAGERTKGCLAGTGFAFIGHTGDVQPCGSFDLALGNVRQRPFSEIWRTSPVLDDLRHLERLKGKCGVCGYKTVCGGCRARAWALTGDYLAAEPSCAFVPDEAIVNRLKRDFPLVARPYAALGRDLGLSEETCYRRVKDLVSRGVLRRVGVFWNLRALGLKSTLVACAVAPEKIDDVAKVVGACAGVTHNYAREGHYNLWFTLVVRSEAEIASVLDALAKRPDVADVLNLPALRLFKLRVDFSPGRAVAPRPPTAPFAPPPDLFRRLRGDLVSLGLEPFKGLDLDLLRHYLESGVVRRTGAVVDPKAAGYAANALTAWLVSDENLEKVGEVLSSSPSVSHCYARERRPNWPYSIYAMVHERTEESLARRIADLAAAVSQRIGPIPDPLVLKTLREYKRTVD